MKMGKPKKMPMAPGGKKGGKAMPPMMPFGGKAKKPKGKF